MPVVAQQTPNPIPIAGELAVPFGTVPGKLLLLGNYLVFLDEQQQESSVVISKDIIERLTAEGSAIAVLTREPVRGRSGELRSLNFRIATEGILTSLPAGSLAERTSPRRRLKVPRPLPPLQKP